jgi:hypothetical protein
VTARSLTGPFAGEIVPEELPPLARLDHLVELSGDHGVSE